MGLPNTTTAAATKSTMTEQCGYKLKIMNLNISNGCIVF